LLREKHRRRKRRIPRLSSPARVANGGGGVRDAETRRRARSSLACLRAARAR
jgi:hypothetical protein